MSTTNPLIFIAGHRGMVGAAIVRALQARGDADLLVCTRNELDLRDQWAVFRYLDEYRPDEVYLAAATVGGIQANDTRRGDFLYDNLVIAANVIEGSRRAKVSRLLFLGSSCIYPRLAPQPMREECLLTGALEPTNEPYAIAKIAGLKLVESYNRQHGTAWFSAMPTNLYGPGDNYDLTGSHVLPGMIRKFHDAKVEGQRPVMLWGSGTAKREFLHVDDLAEACLHILKTCKPGQIPGDLINVGSGQELTIAQLALLVQRVVGHEGGIEWDSSKPDGAPRKLLDCTRIHATGWSSKISLHDGISAAYEDFIAAGAHARGVHALAH